jgi:hypothetical protein
LLTGYLTKKSLPNFHLTAYLNSLGSFLLIYNILTVFILLSLFFIFGNRESWLINLDTAQQQPTAPLWLYMLHSFLELLTAVLTAAWAIGPRLRAGFCRAEVKQQPSYKQPPSTVSYPQNASYQSICPPKSIISSSATNPAKVFKYHNPHYSSSSSRACRSSFRRETIL